VNLVAGFESSYKDARKTLLNQARRAGLRVLHLIDQMKGKGTQESFRSPGGFVIWIALYFGSLLLDFSGVFPSRERKKLTRSQTVFGFIRFASLGIAPEPE
jgi:hypothetical protein